MYTFMYVQGVCFAMTLHSTEVSCLHHTTKILTGMLFTLNSNMHGIPVATALFTEQEKHAHETVVYKSAQNPMKCLNLISGSLF